MRTLGRSRERRHVTCAPGNAGIARDARVVPIRRGRSSTRCSTLAERERIDLTVVGPELAARSRASSIAFARPGIASSVRRSAAAQLECSKAFAKDVHDAPRHSNGALSRLRLRGARRIAVIARGELGLPVVVKADGLAAGKGVVVARDSRGGGGCDPRGDGGAAVRRAGRARRDRGVPERARSVVLRAVRRARGDPAAAPRRITSACSTATAGRTPVAWARSRRARSRMHALAARVMREIVEPVMRGMRGRGARISRVPLCRPHADLRRPEGDRVQRALRRSGSAGCAPAGRGRSAVAAVRRRGWRSRRPPTFSDASRDVAVWRRARIGWLPRRRRRPACRSTGSRRRRACAASKSFTPATALERRSARHGRRARPDGVGRGRDYDEAIARAYEGVGQDLVRRECNIRRDIGQKALLNRT